MRTTMIWAAAAVLLLAGSPAFASDFAVFGSYLDTEDLEDTVGGGVKAGFGEVWQLELRATYLPDLTEDFASFADDPGDDPGAFTNDIEAIPIDVGFNYNFGYDQPVNFYLGGGGSYIFIDPEVGEIDDEVGFYGVGGVEIARRNGGFGFFAEVIYREVEATVDRNENDFNLDDIDDIDLNDFLKRDLDVGGLGANAGIIWRF